MRTGSKWRTDGNGSSSVGGRAFDDSYMKEWDSSFGVRGRLLRVNGFDYAIS